MTALPDLLKLSDKRFNTASGMRSHVTRGKGDPCRRPEVSIPQAV